MSVGKRLDKLEALVANEGGPSDADYKAASERIRYRSWLLQAGVIERYGVVGIPHHCQSFVAAAETALVADTEAQRQRDEEVSQAWREAQGIPAAIEDSREQLLRKLQDIASRRRVEGRPPESMAAALALSIFPNQWREEPHAHRN